MQYYSFFICNFRIFLFYLLFAMDLVFSGSVFCKSLIILLIITYQYFNEILIKKFLSLPSLLSFGKKIGGTRYESRIFCGFDARRLRPCEVVTDSARQPKFRPLFGTLVGSKRARALAYRRRLYYCRCRSKRASVAVDTIWDCPSRRKTAHFQEEGNGTRVPTRRAYRRGVSLSFHGTPRRVDPACQSRHRIQASRRLFSTPISRIHIVPR